MQRSGEDEEMSKDPSFLFYVNDFLSGVMFMTNEQIGIYIKLLCVQHQHGGIIKKDYFNQIVEENKAIRDKFVETEDGFFNVRLSKEMEKRIIKSNNLSLNAKKRWNEYKQLHYKCNASAMPTKDKNKDKDIIDNKVYSVHSIPKTKRFTPPTIEQVTSYCKERKSVIDPELFWHHYNGTGWIKANGQGVQNWKSTVITWEKKQENKVKGDKGGYEGLVKL
jgi:uncharacterized protein YdaU (DUF1376 family)